MTDTDLRRRQEAGQEVETRMREYLINLTQAQELTVSVILCIAFNARAIAFDAFDPNRGEA